MSEKSKVAVTIGLSALVAGMIVSCGDDNENRLCIGNDSLIIELSPGTMWVYRVSEYRYNEKDSTLDFVRAFQDTVTIVKDTAIEGQEWSVTSIEDELWANRSDGLWVWKEFNDDVSGPYLFIKYPTGFGQRYAIPAEDIRPDTMRVTDADALTSVPYGTFSAISYRLSDYQDSLLSLGNYVRGIGKVREIFYPNRNSRPIRRTIELLSFSTPGC